MIVMDYVTRYRQPSQIDAQTGWILVFMASTAQAQEAKVGAPSIFTGQIAQPLIFRNLLLGLRQTVESRFYRPDLWRLLDPVITSGQHLLRLECFSSCARAGMLLQLRQRLRPRRFHRKCF